MSRVTGGLLDSGHDASAVRGLVTSAMQYRIIASTGLLGVLLHACVPIPVEATPPADTSFVKEGVTREQVEDAVGPPEQCESLGPRDFRLCTYEHYGSQAAVILIAVFPPHFLPLPDLTEAPRRAELHVLYRPDDVVEAASGGSGMVFHDYARLWVRADAGDPQAQYEVSRSVRKPREAYRWLCLAASQGLAHAAAELGDINRYGAPGMPADPARAYRWWALAERQGYARASSPKLEAARHVSEDQIAEAERIAAAWQPDDCTAEVEQAFEAQVADGTSSLHHAASSDAAEAARLLVERGADFTAADWKGRTPLELADSGKSQAASEVIREAISLRAGKRVKAMRGLRRAGKS